MNDEMILKIEKCLDKLKQKSIKVNQKGFIINQFFIEKLIYKIQNDILNLRDERNEVYISLNLNQVYQIEIGENKIILFLDNDTEINISI
jgi:hypothetical protein